MIETYQLNATIKNKIHYPNDSSKMEAENMQIQDTGIDYPNLKAKQR